MKIKSNIRRFQEGGAMPPPGAEPMPQEGGAPEGGAPAGGGDPIMELVSMAEQALQAQDPQMALSVCEALLSLVKGSGGPGAGTPPPPAGEPVYRRGGILTKRIR